MAGTLTKEVLDDRDLRRYVEEQMSTVARALKARLEADQRAGLLSADLEPEHVVPVIMTYLQGLFRMALISDDRARLERQIEVFLSGLGL